MDAKDTKSVPETIAIQNPSISSDFTHYDKDRFVVGSAMPSRAEKEYEGSRLLLLAE